MRLKGFSGRSHVLLTLNIFFLFMLIPLDIFKVFRDLKGDLFKLLIVVLVLAGASLICDADSNNSTFVNRTGFIGVLLSTFARSTSLIVWNLYHTKKDKKPLDQHRFLWHTPFIWTLLIYLLLNSISKVESDNMFKYLQGSLSVEHYSVIIALCFILINGYVGISMILSIIKSTRVKLPKFTSYVLSLFLFGYLLTTGIETIRLLLLIIWLGTILHIFEDSFCDTGTFLLFPIPILNKIWQRIQLIPITIETGGNVNKVIDIVSLFTLLFIIYLVVVL